MNRSGSSYGAPLQLPTSSLPSSPVVAATSGPGCDVRDCGERTVLVVDDQHVVLELIDAFLEDSDYRVYLAGGGRQALEMCQRIGPALDLMLSDVRMPGMDGPELYEMVVQRYPRVRVLFMSGFQAAEAVRYGVPAHAPLLVKPFKPAELLERMRQVLTGPARLGGLVARLGAEATLGYDHRGMIRSDPKERVRRVVAAGVLLLLALPAGAARRAAPVAEGVDILRLSPAMARFLVRHVSERKEPETQVKDLVDAILGRKKLGVTYEGSGTRTAIETFETRRGNCLSFTILFVAMARHLGLDAYFHEVAEVISWDRRGEMVVRNQHMIVEVEVENARQRVDFLPGAVKRYRSVRRISDERALAHYYNNLGVDSLAAGDAELALAYFDRAIAADESFSHAWTHRGVAHRRLGDFDAAERSHLRALEIDKNESAALANLASLYLAFGLEEEAQPLLRRVEDHLRRNPFHRFRQGAAAARAGDLAAAAAHYREAIRRMPEEGEFHAALAEALARSGDLKRARESYEKALALTAGEEPRERLRRELAALDGEPLLP